MKSLYLTFDEHGFKAMKKLKERHAKEHGRISWEHFVFMKVTDEKA